MPLRSTFLPSTGHRLARLLKRRDTAAATGKISRNYHSFVVVNNCHSTHNMMRSYYIVRTTEMTGQKAPR